MAKQVGLSVSYFLPRTEWAVSVSRRDVFVVDQDRTYLRAVTDVVLEPSVVPQEGSRQLLTVEASVLEKLDLQLEFDDRGLVESVNSTSQKDLSPVVSLIGTVIGALPGFGLLAEDSLEQAWAERYPVLDGLSTALQERVGTLLAQVSDGATQPDEVVRLGAALDVLQTQLAVVSEARRAWIAGQAEVRPEQTLRLATDDLLSLPELVPSLADVTLPGAQEPLQGAGVLVAVVDPLRAAARRPVPDGRHVDALALRSSRPTTVAVYRRVDDDGTRWDLDTDSVLHMDVCDDYCSTDVVSLDGRWLHERSLTLAYHPDKSLRSYGVGATPTFAAMSTAAGEVLDAAASARKTVAERPGADELALARSTTQLELATTAHEMELLAATRARAAELAVLEQRERLRVLGR